MIAIQQGVLELFIPIIRRIHRESFDQLHRISPRDIVARDDLLQALERRFVHRFAVERTLGQAVYALQPFLDGSRLRLRPRETEFLTVDLVVAVSAPRIQHVDVAASLGIEQARSGGKALRALANDFTTALLYPVQA